MPRTHMHADARCRQIERIVRQNPGVTASQVARQTSTAYETSSAYLRRLVREKRVEVVVELPATSRGCTAHHYPPGSAPIVPTVGKKAA